MVGVTTPHAGLFALRVSRNVGSGSAVRFTGRVVLPSPLVVLAKLTVPE